MVGATHTLTRRGKVTFFRNVDFKYGSYDYWNGYEWYTKRSYPPQNLTELTRT